MKPFKVSEIMYTAAPCGTKNLKYKVTIPEGWIVLHVERRPFGYVIMLGR